MAPVAAAPAPAPVAPAPLAGGGWWTSDGPVIRVESAVSGGSRTSEGWRQSGSDGAGRSTCDGPVIRVASPVSADSRTSEGRRQSGSDGAGRSTWDGPVIRVASPVSADSRTSDGRRQSGSDGDRVPCSDGSRTSVGKSPDGGRVPGRSRPGRCRPMAPRWPARVAGRPGSYPRRPPGGRTCDLPAGREPPRLHGRRTHARVEDDRGPVPRLREGHRAHRRQGGRARPRAARHRDPPGQPALVRAQPRGAPALGGRQARPRAPRRPTSGRPRNR